MCIEILMCNSFFLLNLTLVSCVTIKMQIYIFNPQPFYYVERKTMYIYILDPNIIQSLRSTNYMKIVTSL